MFSSPSSEFVIARYTAQMKNYKVDNYPVYMKYDTLLKIKRRSVLFLTVTECLYVCHTGIKSYGKTNCYYYNYFFIIH